MSRILKKQEQTGKVYIKKLLYIRAFIFAALLLLTVRLFYIQVIRHNYYTVEVNRQRKLHIPLNSGRGIIFDRNMVPLTDRTEEKIAVIFPQLFIQNDDNTRFLQEITGIPRIQLINKISSSRHPIELPLITHVDWRDQRAVNARGVFIVDKKIRYENPSRLTHVIGYINEVDKRGLSGLEKSLDSVLMGNPSKSMAAVLDGRKRLLPGEGYSVISRNTEQKNVKLTIDFEIQKIVEEVLDKHKSMGAVIVSRTDTGEVLSMASRPNYNPNNIIKHIRSSGDELFNKAIQMVFPPGSVFKLVTAAAAIEENRVGLEEEFFCSGIQKVGNTEIKCSSYDDGGNGKISFKQAFAVSCNSTFIQLGQRIGAKNIIETAKTFGLNEKTGIELPEEEKGYLPSGKSLSGPAIGNISIGQGEISVTPIQINQMTQIIANNGIKKPLHIIKNILDADFKKMPEYENKTKEETIIISKETAQTLKHIMHLVMTEGTGTQADELRYVTAGKTGTAQSTEKGQPVLHAWYTGFYPLEQPEYAITVFIQNGESGSRTAVPVFRDILRKIMLLEK